MNCIGAVLVKKDRLVPEGLFKDSWQRGGKTERRGERAERRAEQPAIVRTVVNISELLLGDWLLDGKQGRSKVSGVKLGLIN